LIVFQDEIDATAPADAKDGSAAPVSRGKDLSSIVAAEAEREDGTQTAPVPSPERKVQSIGELGPSLTALE